MEYLRKEEKAEKPMRAEKTEKNPKKSKNTKKEDPEEFDIDALDKMYGKQAIKEERSSRKRR